MISHNSILSLGKGLVPKMCRKPSLDMAGTTTGMRRHLKDHHSMARVRRHPSVNPFLIHRQLHKYHQQDHNHH